MTRFLLATDSVHTTAAACDYLRDRLAEGDEVVVVTVTEEGRTRDGADATNVAKVRLPDADVIVDSRDGEASAEIERAVGDHDPDEVVVGARGGDPGVDRRVGATAEYLVGHLDVPVVVVPLRNR